MSSSTATVGSSGDYYDFPESTVSDFTRSKKSNSQSEVKEEQEQLENQCEPKVEK